MIFIEQKLKWIVFEKNKKINTQDNNKIYACVEGIA